jgi:hypothetical protein
VDGVQLVLVKLQAGAGIPSGRLDAKNLPALGVENPLPHKVIDPSAFGKGRVQSDSWVRPEKPFVEVPLDPLPDSLVPDGDEAADVGAVVVDEPCAQIEDVH